MEGGAEIDFDDLMDLSTQSLFFQRPERGSTFRTEAVIIIKGSKQIYVSL